MKEQGEFIKQSQSQANSNQKNKDKIWVETDSSKLLLKEKFDENY